MKLCVRTLLAGAVVLSTLGCSEEGSNAEDRRRLEVLSEDPISTLLPPGATSEAGSEKVLAETDDGRFAGCCTNAIVTTFQIDVSVKEIVDFYVAALEAGGCVNGQVDVLAGGHRKSSLVANESPRVHASLLRVVRWVSR